MKSAIWGVDSLLEYSSSISPNLSFYTIALVSLPNTSLSVSVAIYIQSRVPLSRSEVAGLSFLQ